MKTKEPSKVQRKTTTAESNHCGVLPKKQADIAETMNIKKTVNKIHTFLFTFIFSLSVCSLRKVKIQTFFFFILLLAALWFLIGLTTQVLLVVFFTDSCKQRTNNTALEIFGFLICHL